MCEPVTTGLIISALSGGGQAINQNQALRRKDKQAAEGIRRQGDIQSDSNARVGEQIEDIASSTGQSEKAQSLEGFLNAIRAAKGDTEGALSSPIAAANPRFAEQVAGGKAGIAKAGAEQSGRLSRIDAPRFQRINEGARIGRTGSDLSEQARRSTAEDFLTRLRVASETPNDLVSALTTVGKGVGSAVTLGAGGGANLAKLFGKGTLVDPTLVSGSPFIPTGLS
jgi:hypothetical protein